MLEQIMNIKDVDESIQLKQKELARLYRHKAYLCAKEFRKTDPQQITIQERLKAEKREAYCKAKEKMKALKEEQKRKSANKIATKKAASRAKIIDTLIIGSTIKSGKTKSNTQK